MGERKLQFALQILWCSLCSWAFEELLRWFPISPSDWKQLFAYTLNMFFAWGLYGWPTPFVTATNPFYCEQRITASVQYLYPKRVLLSFPSFLIKKTQETKTPPKKTQNQPPPPQNPKQTNQPPDPPQKLRTKYQLLSWKVFCCQVWRAYAVSEESFGDQSLLNGNCFVAALRIR